MHLWDYVAVVRNHWPLSLLVAAAIAAYVVLTALYATPAYEASARIEIEMDPGQRSDFATDLMWFGTSTYVGTEVEVLRSYAVAAKAAEDPHARPRAIITEKNAYRPLETLLRELRSEAWAPCILSLDVDHLPGRDEGFTWRFTFDETRRRLAIYDAPEEGRREIVENLVLGEPFTDRNYDGRWNDAEPFTDENGDRIYDAPEPFTDTNENGRLDKEERYEDLNGDGKHDAEGEPFVDLDGDGVRSGPEDYVDRDGNGAYTRGRPFTVFGRVLALNLEEGDPADRTFFLRVRSLRSTAKWIHGRTRVGQVADWTGIVDITFASASPSTAANVANALARSYQELKQARKRERLDLRVRWLKGELQKVREALNRAYEARDRFVGEQKAAQLSERAQGLYDQQSELIKQRFELEQKLRRAQAQLGALANGREMDDLLIAIGGSNVDSQTQTLVALRTDLQIERAVLLEGAGTERTPRVVEIERRLQLVERQLQASVAALVEERRVSLTYEKESLEASLQQVGREENRQQQLLDALPDTERKLIELARPIETNEQFYASLITSLKEAQMSSASAISGAHLIDPAFPPTARKSPSLTKTVVVAILLSLLGGIGLAFLREYLSRTVMSPKELEETLGLPLYATIPAFHTVRRKARGGGRNSPMITVTAPNSVLAEAYRALRANVLYAKTSKPLSSLAITSPTDQEGKTITTLNLAVVLAQAGSKVMVVDADTRRPTTHVHLQREREPGLTDVIRGEANWEDVRSRTSVPQLDLIPAGPTPENPGALLDSEPFRELLRDLTAQYEYVLFDVPPVLAVADAAAFLRHLDGVLLLVRARRYTLDVAESALDQIERLGANTLGTIFNAVDARRVARRGYGYYGYYGRYGGRAAD